MNVKYSFIQLVEGERVGKGSGCRDEPSLIIAPNTATFLFSYEDSPNGLDLTTDASRQSSAATSPPEAARSPPVTARSPPANARSPAAPATRSPGPMDLKIKDDRHSNLSPQGLLLNVLEARTLYRVTGGSVLGGKK